MEQNVVKQNMQLLGNDDQQDLLSALLAHHKINVRSLTFIIAVNQILITLVQTNISFLKKKNFSFVESIHIIHISLYLGFTHKTNTIIQSMNFIPS